jgi:hypothetical protein
MTIRWVVYSIFLVFVLVSSLASSCLRAKKTEPKPEWLAIAELQPNTRISPDFLVQPDFPTPISAWGLPEKKSLEGKYTAAKIEKNSVIDSATLSTLPHLQAEKDTALLVFSVQGLGSSAAILNAGCKVYVCEAEKSCSEAPYTVVAVLGKPEISEVVIQASKADADTLVKLSKPQLRLASLPW